jgi:hypothetical protein
MGIHAVGSGPFLPYSPKCVEGEFCELRLYGVLRSSHKALSTKFGFGEFCEVHIDNPAYIALARAARMASKGLRGGGPEAHMPRGRGLLQHRARETLVLAPPCNRGTPMQRLLVSSLTARTTGAKASGKGMLPVWRKIPTRPARPPGSSR